MIDIALIREKPEWVKEQIAKLNDPTALARIDEIVELDKQRRALLSEAEAIQAARNKSMGQLRGNKKLDDATRGAMAQRATEAIVAGDYNAAERAMTEPGEGNSAASGALEKLNDALRGMGERVEKLNEQIKQVEAELDENMLWIPNLPHESVPVADSEERSLAQVVRRAARAYVQEHRLGEPESADM